MKIIFFGSDGLAKQALQRLLQQPWCDIQMVVTPPDRPAGRKQLLQPTVIKCIAKTAGLPVTHDHSHLPPADVGVVVYYGKKIPRAVIDRFPHGIVNIHPSLLPRWRGPSPIKSAIWRGDLSTGVTLMLIDSGMDTGPLLAQAKAIIDPLESADQLEQRLGNLGADLLVETLPAYVNGQVAPQAQALDGITQSQFIDKADGELRPNQTAIELWNQYRAMQPWPGVFFMHQGKRYKITSAHWNGERCLVDMIQPEGKKPMTLSDFKRGYPTVLFADII